MPSVETAPPPPNASLSAGAVLMVVGIFTIATNPLALFHRKEQ